MGFLCFLVAIGCYLVVALGTGSETLGLGVAGLVGATSGFLLAREERMRRGEEEHE